MRTIVAFFLLFVFLLTGCRISPAQKETQEFRVNLVTNPTTLDPAKARDLDAFSVLRMLFEGLTRIGTSEEPELALASALSISEDQKTYTFILRPSRWSFGDSLTAHDFVFAWRRALDPAFPSDYSSQLYVIKNGKEIKEGKVAKEELGVCALSNTILQVELTKPIPYFLELLSFPVFFPLPQEWVERHPGFANDVSEYVSNGPFRLKKWKYDDELVLIKNTFYWDSETVKLKKVTLVMVDPEAEISMFLNNELDWAGSPMSSLPVDSLKALNTEGRVKIKPFTGMVFIRLNTTKPALRNPTFRRAMGLAVNRKELVEHVTRGGQIPSTTFVPERLRHPNCPSFKDGAVEEAKELLEKVDMSAHPEVTLLYSMGKRSHLVAQALQDQWRKSLGVRIKLEASERKVFFGRLSKGDFDMALADWVADFNDPINFLEILKSKDQGTNRTGWESKKYAQMLESSFSISNKEERLALLADAEKLMLDEMPIIPLDQAAMVYIHHDWVKGVFVSSMGNLELKKAYIEHE